MTNLPNAPIASKIFDSLDQFRIELPSWGFADTGTRFGKYLQPAAAVPIEEKISDAAHVHQLTGVCPTIALHVQWDFSQGRNSAAEVAAVAKRYGVRPGSINPNFFQNQEYKFGSFGKDLGSRDVSLWFADGSNYPGTANIRHRKKWFEELLALAHGDLSAGQRMLIEYKPFEPAFYHTLTPIGAWRRTSRAPQVHRREFWSIPVIITPRRISSRLWRGYFPKICSVDSTLTPIGAWRRTSRAPQVTGESSGRYGHHYAAQNIEQIVAWLLSENMLGGFHFNDRRYADDDLTLGSIDPYQVFRIFSEIRCYEWETGAANSTHDIAYMIDQSHNLKGKIEAMIQTVTVAQELWAKAALVDHERLSAAQAAPDLIRAEACLQEAFATDVRPAIREWRESKYLPADPMQPFRDSGYLERVTADRAPRKASNVSSYA